jgi:starch-binding outer membrane protein, SusD/RagB family
MMKIIMKTKYLILLGFLLNVGCKDDFIDLKPLGQQTEISYYSNISAIRDQVTAAYAQLYPYELMDVYYLLDFGNIGSDDVELGGSGTSDQPECQNIDRMLHDATLTRPANFYRYMYKGIRMANTALYYIPVVEESDTTAKTTAGKAELNRLKGEALFLRAFYHFCLAQVYGGVVVVNDYSKDYTKEKRNTLKETYQAIEKDLDEAIPLLKERSEMGTEIGRATKSAAKSYKVKLLVYESSYAKNYPGDKRFEGMQERWSDAASLAKEIITSNVYSLVGKNGETYPSWWNTKNDGTIGNVGAFRYLFSVDGDNSTESIWEVQDVMDKSAYGLIHGCYLTRYTTVKTVEGLTQEKGWGWNCPTKYLVDAFGNKDSRETGLNSSAANEKDDPRFAVTIGTDDDTIYTSGDTPKADMKWRKMIPSAYSSTGMIGRKFECSPLEFMDVKGSDGDGPFNIRLMRYADLLLLAAEAAFNNNDKASALNYVNQVRTRARLSGSTGFPVNLTDINFDDIIHERRLELALEGHRFFDLMRWNLGQKYVNGVQIGLALNYNFTVEFKSNKHEFFPIPNTEIQLSGGVLEQNPGY